MVSQKDINARMAVIQTYITVDQARNYIANQGYVAHTNLLQGRTAGSFMCQGSCSWTCSGGCSRGAGNR